MAIVEIIDNPVDSEELLFKLINYIRKSSKNEIWERYTYSKNLSLKNAFEEMMETINLFDKNFGRRAYHMTISFSRDEPITASDAFDISQDFINNFFDDYQVFSNVHTKQDYIHIHLAINTTSLIDGKKLHIDFTSLQKYREYIQYLTRNS